ncbi:MAG: carboxypeptidase regulatory-like domain-containing protein [Bdellovibrionales bacterium]|nr:carboxypeptidase regulatory-like domain-containing protein [Bdellovibrionales bacterium]
MMKFPLFNVVVAGLEAVWDSFNVVGRGLLLLLFIVMPFSPISAETFILNGDTNFNCVSGSPAPLGEECAKSPLISSDWKMRVLRENGAGSLVDVLLDKDPPINDWIQNVETNSHLGAPGDFTILEISKRSLEGEECFLLGDVWLHEPGETSDGECRFLLHRRPPSDYCGASPARLANNVRYFPSGCGDNAIRAEFVDLPSSIEVGERKQFSLRLASGMASDGYTLSGCYPARLVFKSDLKERALMSAVPLEESFVSTGAPSNLVRQCESGLQYHLGLIDSTLLSYTVTPRERGVARFDNSSRVSAVFDIGSGDLQAVSANPRPEPIQITGGLDLQVQAPRIVKPGKQKSFTVVLSLHNRGKGAMNVSGKDCNLLAERGADLIVATTPSGFERDFPLAGGQNVDITCNFQALGEGIVDLNVDTFWTHASGGEVLTRLRCDEHGSTTARCVKGALANTSSDVIRIGISKDEATCGDGVVDPDEDCDGGACCTENCEFVERGKRCRGKSACATGDGLCFGDLSFCPGEVDGDGILSVDFELLTPVGPSPKVFTRGWEFGVEAVAQCKNGNSRTVSEAVEWSGSGSFFPSRGTRSRPSFQGEGSNTIVLSYSGERLFQQSFNVDAISPAGFAAVGDIAFCPADAHGSLGGPYQVEGPIVGGSSLVTVAGAPAARVGDPGVHASCSGPNSFLIADGDPEVIISGRRASRSGDETQHCGGIGSIRDVASAGRVRANPRSTHSDRRILRLDGQGSILGTVRSSSGSPLANIQVVFTDTHGEIVATWSDTDGTFLVSGLPSGSYSQRCQGGHLGYYTSSYSGSDAEPIITLNGASSFVNADCTLDVGGVISGQVLTEGGEPLPDVWVLASARDGRELTSQGVKSTASGAFAIDGLQEGEYFLFASAEQSGYLNRYYPSALSIDDAKPVPVIGSSQTRGVAIVFPSDLSALSCELSDTDGVLQAKFRTIQQSLEVASNQALRLMKSASRSSNRISLGSLKGQRRKVNRFLGLLANAVEAFPVSVHSACAIPVGCSENSSSTRLANFRSYSMKLLRLVKQTSQRATRAASILRNKQRKLFKKIRKIGLGINAALDEYPISFVECS